MSGIDETLKARLAILSDEVLLQIVEKKSDEYTPEAMAFVTEEVTHRGGLEDLRKKVEHAKEPGTPGSEKKPLSKEALALMKRSYIVLVIVCYGLFMYVINASLWFYWILLFALIASLFAVLFRPRFDPEQEIKELVARMGNEAEQHADSEA